MKIWPWLTLTFGGLLMASTPYAHHSFSATYREDQVIEIEGELVQFLFRNPHSFVHVVAADESGTTRRWTIEWGSAAQIGGQGVTRELLRPGDHVVINGNPGRNETDYRIRMRTLFRPADGFRWGFDNEDFD